MQYVFPIELVRQLRVDVAPVRNIRALLTVLVVLRSRQFSRVGVVVVGYAARNVRNRFSNCLALALAGVDVLDQTVPTVVLGVEIVVRVVPVLIGAEPL